MGDQAPSTTVEDPVADLFPGSSRHDVYADAGSESPPAPRVPAETSARGVSTDDAPQSEVVIPVELPPRQAPPQNQSTALAGTVVAGELLTPQDADATRATTSRASWKAWLAKMGLSRGTSTAATVEEEAARRRWETTIRQTTWVRAVNIAVVTGKGGDGSTPAALVLGGILADVRGGSVAVFEATATSGALTARAEGKPRRGLGELLAGADLIASAGNLAGYTAPQTSYAAVIGSVGYRPQLTPADVRSARKVLDTYYQLTVSDMDHNLDAPSSRAAQRSADAVVVPTVANARSLRDAVETVTHLQKTAMHLFGCNDRDPGPVVVVLGHSGAPEDARLAGMAHQWLEEQLRGLAWVVEAPYEPVFGGDHEVTLADLSGPSRRAWTHAAGLVVRHIKGEEPVTFEGDST